MNPQASTASQFTPSLSSKTNKLVLLIICLLSLLLALLQGYFRLKSQQELLQQEFDELFLSSQNYAQIALNHKDAQLAEQVIEELKRKPYVVKAAIVNDHNKPIALYTSEKLKSSTGKLTALIVKEPFLNYSAILHGNYIKTASLQFTVDVDRALAPKFSQLIGFLAIYWLLSVSFGLLLFGVFRQFFLRPIALFISHLTTLTRSENASSISEYGSHRDDRFKSIIESVNKLSTSIESGQKKVAASQSQLKLIVDAIPTQAYIMNGIGEFLLVNIAAAKYYNVMEDTLLGSYFNDTHSQIDPSEADELWVMYRKILRSKTPCVNAQKTLSTSSKVKSLITYISCWPITYFEQPCLLVTVADVTEKIAAKKKIEKLAYYDSLTNLPNRHMLYKKLSSDIITTKNDHCVGAFLVIGIGDFKRITDILGHQTGDQLLTNLVGQIQLQIRQQDTLARLDGDEFALSLPSLGQTFDIAQTRASELAARLIKIISSPVTIDNNELLVGASIGIVMFQDQHPAKELLRFADNAVYQARKAGRGCYRFFEVAMEKAAKKRIDLEVDIRKALENDDFTFFLQPVIDSKSGSLVSAEALVRWPRVEKGIVMPEDYIDYLEDSGMINSVGHRILEKVCQYLVQLKKAKRIPQGFRIAVNISAVQLYQVDFFDKVRALLADYDLEGAYLEFEITESTALYRLDEAIATISRLKSLNITFALDDFGTGYSSLSYLKQLPIDKIKIDKTFIRDMIDDKKGEALVASIIAIAQNLNLDIIAEGVEQAAQATWLANHRNIKYQGYLCDKAMPSDDFSRKYLSISYLSNRASLCEQ